MFQWLLGELLYELRRMERRIMSEMSDKLKAAEDRIGGSIADAIATNKSNLDKLAAAMAASGTPDADLQAILDEATAHADQLAQAFPAQPAAAPDAPKS